MPLADDVTQLAARQGLEPAQLLAPADTQQLVALEGALGTPLPPDVRELYLTHDGQDRASTGLFLGLRWLPVGEVLREVQGWRDVVRADDTGMDGDRVSDTLDAVAEVYWHPQWLPLAEDGGGNFLAVDLAPGPRGTVGQVINAGRDERLMQVLAPSVGELLRRMLVQLGNGFDVSDGHLFDDLPEFLAPFGDAPVVPDEAWVETLDPAWQAYIAKRGGPRRFVEIREFASKGTGVSDYGPLGFCTALKTLRIWPEQPLPDLFAVPALPALRELNVMTDSLEGIERFAALTTLILPQGTPQVDLAPLHGLPRLEQLWLSSSQRRAGELPRLAALRSLRVDIADASVWTAVGASEQLTDLTVSMTQGAASTVRLERLRDLRSLSLSGAPGVSLEALAGSTKLRSLKLSSCDDVDLAPLASCPRLTSLQLDSCDRLQGLESLRTATQLTDVMAGYEVFLALRDFLPEVGWGGLSGRLSQEQKDDWFAWLDARQA